MKAFIRGQFDQIRPLFEGKDAQFGWAWPLFEGAETFFLTPHHATKTGAHVRDHMDMKRLMIFVLYALAPAILLGWWNIGRQGFLAEGVTDYSAMDAILRGGWHMLPLIITSYTAGGIAELVFCIVRKHEINEGFLVTAMLFPLTLPPTIPLWMAAAGIVFGVVIGKEVFGGVGMNILNPALTARAFVFFTYPAAISGAAGVGCRRGRLVGPGLERGGRRPRRRLHRRDPAAGRHQRPDGLRPGPRAGRHGAGATTDLAIGAIPGSMGEVSAIGAAIGAVFLVTVGIASWRTMVACVVGLFAMAAVLNGVRGPRVACGLPSCTSALPPGDGRLRLRRRCSWRRTR